MKTRVLVIASIATTSLAIVTLAIAALALVPDRAPGAERHIRATLDANGGTGVSGFVELTQLPRGGTEIEVVANGLHPGTQYASFYYDSPDCTEPADALGGFTAGADGTGTLHSRADDDLDEIGSVSVRLGPGYGALQACARVH